MSSTTPTARSSRRPTRRSSTCTAATTASSSGRTRPPGKGVGDACRVRLEPEDAFGDYDAELVQIEPIDKFPQNVAVGMQFEGQSGESGKSRVYTVTDIADGKVVLDGNHPLAGRALDFSCKVTAVRAATKEEMTHGHVHGPHGHHHVTAAEYGTKTGASVESLVSRLSLVSNLSVSSRALPRT